MNEPTKKILVAFDDSPSSYKAFEFMLGMVGNCLGGPYMITVLSVIQLPDLIDVPMDVEPMIEAERNRFETAHQTLKEMARKANQNIVTECILGHAAKSIVEYVNDNHFDMVILGNRGRSRIEEWLLGSVSHYVATHTHCTVTIVK